MTSSPVILGAASNPEPEPSLPASLATRSAPGPTPRVGGQVGQKSEEQVLCAGLVSICRGGTCFAGLKRVHLYAHVHL